MNPVRSVRGPPQTAGAANASVLTPNGARAVIDSIDVTTRSGPRDRASIALMVCAIARIGAEPGLKVPVPNRSAANARTDTPPGITAYR